MTSVLCAVNGFKHAYPDHYHHTNVVPLVNWSHEHLQRPCELHHLLNALNSDRVQAGDVVLIDEMARINPSNSLLEQDPCCLIKQLIQVARTKRVTLCLISQWWTQAELALLEPHTALYLAFSHIEEAPQPLRFSECLTQRGLSLPPGPQRGADGYNVCCYRVWAVEYGMIESVVFNTQDCLRDFWDAHLAKTLE